MRPLFRASLLLMCVCALGCERAADVEHPTHYDHNGISFDYPGNWEIESDEVDPEGFRTIIIGTPGDGVAMVQHFKHSPAVGLDEYAKLFSEMTREEMPFGHVSEGQYKPYTYTTKQGARKLKGIQQNFDITVLDEHVPHARGYFGFDEHLPNTVMICQVASEDLDKVRPGCDLVLDRLKVAAP